MMSKQPSKIILFWVLSWAFGNEEKDDLSGQIRGEMNKFQVAMKDKTSELKGEKKSFFKKKHR